MSNRPFDLKAALSGEPVLWRGSIFKFVKLFGSETRCLEFRNVDGSHTYLHTNLDGIPYPEPKSEPVLMAPRKVKKTVWVNINKCDVGYSCAVYSEQESASRVPNALRRVATAVPVEIEVEE